MGGPGKPVCSRENKGGQNGDMTRLPGDVGNLIRDTTMKDERGGTERVHKRTTDIWHCRNHGASSFAITFGDGIVNS